MAEKVRMGLRSSAEQIEAGKEYRIKYPDKVPILIICDKASKIDMKNEVYLCNREHTFGYLMMQIRKKISLKESEGLFYFIGNSLLGINTPIGELDKKNCLDGGFLIITVAKENVFGRCPSCSISKMIESLLGINGTDTIPRDYILLSTTSDSLSKS
jgi:hypothetical protein